MPVLSADLARAVGASILEAAGAPADVAAEVAGVLVDNHLAGHDSHGLLRVPGYVRAVRDGRIAPAARPSVERDGPSTALVRGHWAFGQVTARFAVDLAAGKARRAQVAVVAVVEAGHTGRLAAFTEPAAARGVVVLMTVGTSGTPTTAPFGGASPTLGTNPIAVSVPRPTGPPVTMDIATSAIAAGKVKVAHAEGRTVPPGSILRATGEPTTDPADFLGGGMLLPFGGHKGYALAVLVDLLSGPLVGADAWPGAEPRSGILVVAVAADAFRPRADFDRAVAATTARITAARPSPGSPGVLLPGEPEASTRARRERDGIPLAEATWAALHAVARDLGVDTARWGA